MHVIKQFSENLHFFFLLFIESKHVLNLFYSEYYTLSRILEPDREPEIHFCSLTSLTTSACFRYSSAVWYFFHCVKSLANRKWLFLRRLSSGSRWVSFNSSDVSSTFCAMENWPRSLKNSPSMSYNIEICSSKWCGWCSPSVLRLLSSRFSSSVI